MYIVTGGAGMIGSVCVEKLNEQGINDIIIVDNIHVSQKWKNLVGKKYTSYIHKEKFIDLINKNMLSNVKAVIHMGACSTTVEENFDYLYENNYLYSVSLAKWCLKNNIRFIYASSGATYGAGENKYCDSDENTLTLLPLNRYGYSKHIFDLWVLRNNYQHSLTGLKFFNVYGPNEYHKGNMVSLAYKALEQIKKTNNLNLFKSYDRNYKNGEQLRDFVYVKDCIDVIMWFIDNPDCNGIFNVGTGKAQTWNQVGTSIFKAMNQDPKITYIEMPDSLKKQYQYFTEADISKLRKIGYKKSFFDLEKGINDYYQNYLLQSNKYE